LDRILAEKHCSNRLRRWSFTCGIAVGRLNSGGFSTGIGLSRCRGEQLGGAESGGIGDGLKFRLLQRKAAIIDSSSGHPNQWDKGQAEGHCNIASLVPSKRPHHCELSVQVQTTLELLTVCLSTAGEQWVRLN
jgi:hypothetical protein